MSIIRTDYGYMESRENVFLEQQSKLFEKIADSKIDWSYAFTFPRTSETMKAIGNPVVDVISKPIYRTLFAEVIGDDGAVLFTGQLRVERITKTEISASFLAGNYNWLSLITGNLADLRWYDYDTALDYSAISGSWTTTEGVKFPILDAGAMITRSWHSMKIEDFVGCLYVKTIFKNIFYSAGIKLKGELFNDVIYNTAIIAKNSKNKTEIENDSCYANLTSSVARPTENADVAIIFDDDSTDPYFDGSNNAYNSATGEYIAPVKMRVLLECTLTPSIIDARFNNRIKIFVNGAWSNVEIGITAGTGTLYQSSTPGDQATFSIVRELDLEAGDVLLVKSHWQDSLGSLQNDITAGTLKITPLFIYNMRGADIVPNWTKKQFVNNIFNLFNIVTDFDPITKELTCNFFDRIKTKTPVDISEYVDPDTIEADYTDFISKFNKKNYLTYSNTNPKDVTQTDDIRKYNVQEFLKYGQGEIDVVNDYLNESGNMIENDFAAPISYINKGLDCSLERINFIELQEKETANITTVGNSGGKALFNMTGNPFLVGDLVRIESTVVQYNGDWIVESRSASVISVTAAELSGGSRQMNYIGDATGTITKLQHSYTDSDDVFIFIYIDSISYGDFTGLTENPLVDGSAASAPALAFFSLIDKGRTINTNYQQSLSYGDINSPFFYQRTLVDTYWRVPGEILNDPVKISLKATLPKPVFLSLTPLTPIYLKSNETVNLYYRNKISGYINKKTPCEVELIKL